VGNCCTKKAEEDDKKVHRRNAPSTISYDFERQKGMQRALKDIGRRQVIKVKPLNLSKTVEINQKQMGKRKDAFKHHI
jgi:hypothetical protein